MAVQIIRLCIRAFRISYRAAAREISLSRVARRWWSQTFLVVTTQRCKKIYSRCSLYTFTTMCFDGGGLLTAN